MAIGAVDHAREIGLLLGAGMDVLLGPKFGLKLGSNACAWALGPIEIKTK